MAFEGSDEDDKIVFNPNAFSFGKPVSVESGQANKDSVKSNPKYKETHFETGSHAAMSNIETKKTEERAKARLRKLIAKQQESSSTSEVKKDTPSEQNITTTKRQVKAEKKSGGFFGFLLGRGGKTRSAYEINKNAAKSCVSNASEETGEPRAQKSSQVAQPEKKAHEPSKTSQKFTRRDFMKLSGSVSALAAISGIPFSGEALKYYLQKLDERNQKNYEQDQADEQKKVENEVPEITPEQNKKEEENKIISSQIFKYRPGEYVPYGQAQVDAQDKYWYDLFSNEKKRRPEIRKAYGKVMSWVELQGSDSLRDIFEQKFLNEIEKYVSLSFEEEEDLFLTYIALVIRESAGNPRAYSKKSASGLHQIMMSNAESLEVKGNIDERNDPIESAKVLCGLLRTFFHRYGKNFGLMWQGINGVIGSYWLKCGKTGEDMSEEGLNQFIEDDLNSKEYYHKKRKGQKLIDIMALYGVEDANEIYGLNPKLSPEKEIPVGSRIKLPDIESVRKKIFEQKAEKYGENTNYRSAIKQIKQVLVEMKERGELPGAEERLIVAEERAVDFVGQDEIIKIAKGETLDGLAKRHEMTRNSLIALNGLRKEKGEYRIYAGQKIYVHRKYLPSLEILADGDDGLFEKLCILNPKVKKSNIAIRRGALLRFPNK